MRHNHKDEILHFIKSSYREKGYPPSIGEIALATGLSSKFGVLKQLRQLVEEGSLLNSDGKYLPVDFIGTERDMVAVPIIGTIAAGIPIEAIQDFDGFVSFLPRHSTNGDKLFALRVKGNSMIEAGINDSDIVIVEQTPVAENGQIVAAMIDGEATIKTFFKENGHFRLQPENSTMEPIIVDHVEVLGRVVSSQRYY